MIVSQNSRSFRSHCRWSECQSVEILFNFSNEKVEIPREGIVAAVDEGEQLQSKSLPAGQSQVVNDTVNDLGNC